MRTIDVSKGKSKRVYRSKKSSRRGNLNKKRQFDSFRWHLLLSYEVGDVHFYNGCRLRSVLHGIAILRGLNDSSWTKKEILKNYYSYR